MNNDLNVIMVKSLCWECKGICNLKQSRRCWTSQRIYEYVFSSFSSSISL